MIRLTVRDAPCPVKQQNEKRTVWSASRHQTTLVAPLSNGESRTLNAERSTLNVQVTESQELNVESWALGVGRWGPIQGQGTNPGTGNLANQEMVLGGD